MQIFCNEFYWKKLNFIHINESLKQLLLVNFFEQTLSKFYVEWIFFHIFK